jgi:hypothetical protein
MKALGALQRGPQMGDTVKDPTVMRTDILTLLCAQRFAVFEAMGKDLGKKKSPKADVCLHRVK